MGRLRTCEQATEIKDKPSSAPGFVGTLLVSDALASPFRPHRAARNPDPGAEADTWNDFFTAWKARAEALGRERFVERAPPQSRESANVGFLQLRADQGSRRATRRGGGMAYFCGQRPRYLKFSSV